MAKQNHVASFNIGPTRGTRGHFSGDITVTADAAKILPGIVGGDRISQVVMNRYHPALDSQLALFAVIGRTSERLSFNRFNEFMRQIFCLVAPAGDIVDQARVNAGWTGTARAGLSAYSGTRAYQLVKEAADIFLQSQCGVWPTDKLGFPKDPMPFDQGRNEKEDTNLFPKRREQRHFGDKPDAPGEDLGERLERPESDFTRSKLNEFWDRYVNRVEGNVVDTTPYFRSILDKLRGVPIKTEDPGQDPDCNGILSRKLQNPCLIELIWSYWMEQGMMVQAINALSLRFQNKRTAETDVLARFDVDPLRPLSNLLFGYIQDEQNRLTLVRRSYEYDHHYGLRLIGRAVPPLQPADSRSGFLEAFHNLLRECARYYKAITNTFIVPDTFPALNALRELQLILTEGMHNQYGDLPSTARAEMLTQQWLLSRPELLQFVGQRTMVPYPEPWIGYVDTIRQLQGWGDTTCRHFRDLAICGERVLLAVRFGDWADNNNEVSAALFMSLFREDVQTYIHAYRAVTGVDLGLEDVHARDPQLVVTQPSDLLARRAPARGPGALPPGSRSAGALPMASRPPATVR